MMTTRLTEAPWRHRHDFDRLCDMLGARHDEVRLVGGAVRDGLLGMDVNDIDLATLHTPEEVTRRLEPVGIKVVPTGIAHGTVTAVIDRHPFEITTLRRDVGTDGRRATISYTQDWREDAARRDFTINALYAEPKTGIVHDYFGGLEDLEQRHVRFIGDAGERIAEDHLRILRYFRFLARFGTLPPDEAAYRACTERANSLMALSRERIADELLKLLALLDPLQVVRLMFEGGIFAPVVPEIDADGIERLAMLLKREAAAGIAEPAALRRLTALLPNDPRTSEQVAARLKLSAKARKRIVAALTPVPQHQNSRELAYRLGGETAIDQILLRPEMDIAGVAQISGWEIPRLPFGGRDLLAMGIDAGPQVAQLLNDIGERWIAAGFPPRDETEELARQTVTEFREASQ